MLKQPRLLRVAVVAICTTLITASAGDAGAFGSGAHGPAQAEVAKKKCSKKRKRRCRKRTAPAVPVTPPAAVQFTPPVTPVPQHTLSVSKTGGGSGTVTSTPAAISCG